MPATQRWAENETVLVVHLSGRLTASEINVTVLGVLESLEKTDQTLHLLVNFEDVVFYPALKDILANGIRLVSHPKMGWIAMISVNAILRFWIGAVNRIVTMRCQAVGSASEGWQFIHQKKKEAQVLQVASVDE